MIQRIQSIYLLLVTGLLIASMCLPVGSLIDFNGAVSVFKPLGLTMGDTFQSTWGLFCILMLAAIVAFATIFLFKNRILQIRMTIFNSLLFLSLFTFVCLMYQQYNDTFHELRMQLENQVVQIQKNEILGQITDIGLAVVFLNNVC